MLIGKAVHSAASPSEKAPQFPPVVKQVIRRGTTDAPRQRGGSQLAGARLWVWTLTTLAICVLGGANNTYPVPRGLAEILAALLLGCVIASRNSRFEGIRRSDWLIVAMIALMLVQFIPLPPAIWSALPGREVIVQIDRSVFGELTWRPITLDIEQSWRSLMFLIPAVTYYIAIRTGDHARLEAILRGFVIALLVGAAMAFLQITSQAWAFPFADGRADNSFAIGFFTNHNHQATFIVMGLMALAGLIALGRKPRRDRSQWTSLGPRDMILGALAIIAALLVLLTGSRAGLLLLAIGLPAGACAWLAPQLAGSRQLLFPALGVVALAAIAFLALPFLADGQLSVIGDRSALGDDRRFEIWPQAAATAWHMMPTGSGFGTFRPTYEMFEPLDAVGMLYVNHAHNDYLQLAIEGGVAAILLIFAFIVAWLTNGWRAWTTMAGRDALLARLGFVIVLVVMLHSLVDYPARTVTLSMLAATGFALLVRFSAQSPTRLATPEGAV